MIHGGNTCPWPEEVMLRITNGKRVATVAAGKPISEKQNP